MLADEVFVVWDFYRLVFKAGAPFVWGFGTGVEEVVGIVGPVSRGFPFGVGWGRPGARPGGPCPVEVESPGGERVFSGTVAIWGWNASHNNHIYRIETDPDTGEQVVARYRFMEPLE